MCLSFFLFRLVICLSARPRLASRWHLSAAGEGVFTDGAVDPQVLFYRKMTFFAAVYFKRLNTVC